MILRATKEHELAGILDEIHDWNFNLYEGLARQNRGRVEFALTPPHLLFGTGEPSANKTLTIQNVRAVELLDTNLIGIYDINRILFDQSKGTVEVLTGVPLLLKFRVSSLDLELSYA
jgi:hypothetical protein